MQPRFCIVPTEREHVTWNEFRAMNPGVPLALVQQDWRATPWSRPLEHIHVAAAAAPVRVSWNNFQRILRGKSKQARAAHSVKRLDDT